MCQYSLYTNGDDMRKAKVGETLTRGTYRSHEVFKGDDGKLACIKHGTTLVIDEVRFLGAAGWLVDKHAGKSLTATFIEGTRRGYGRHYAADCIQLEDGFAFPFHLLAEGVTARIPRKVRKDKGVRKVRSLDKVFGLDHVAAILPPDPKPEGEDAPSTPAEPVNPVKEPAPEREPEKVA